MTDYTPAPAAQAATATEQTVAIARHRREITKRMTRKQTELRLDALAALVPSAMAPQGQQEQPAR